MAALPSQPQRPLLTVAEYAALPEDLDGVKYELVEGNPATSPRPLDAHQYCIHELLHQLRDQVPDRLVGLAEVDVDEYADASIPHYWVVDLGEPDDRPQLTAHHLAGEFGYVDAGPVNGIVATTEPFPSGSTSTRWCSCRYSAFAPVSGVSSRCDCSLPDGMAVVPLASLRG